MNDLIQLLKRTVRVSATFAVLTVIGFALGHYAFHVPLADLPTAVAVPILWLFAMSRVFVALLPANPPQTAGAKPKVVKLTTVRVVYMAVTLVCLLAAIGAIVALLSAGTYYLLSVQGLMSRSLHAAALSASVCLAIVVFFSVMIVRRYILSRVDVLVATLWEICRWPARLADWVPHLPKLNHRA